MLTDRFFMFLEPSPVSSPAFIPTPPLALTDQMQRTDHLLETPSTLPLSRPLGLKNAEAVCWVLSIGSGPCNGEVSIEETRLRE